MTDRKALADALTLAREYVEGAAQRGYDGTNGHGIRKEATRRLALIDDAIARLAAAADTAQPPVPSDGTTYSKTFSADELLEQECGDADELLRLLGLEPDACRTEAGFINLPKVKSLLRERSAALAAPPVVPPPLRAPMCRISGVNEDVLRRAALANPVPPLDHSAVPQGDVLAPASELRSLTGGGE